MGLHCQLVKACLNPVESVFRQDATKFLIKLLSISCVWHYSSAVQLSVRFKEEVYGCTGDNATLLNKSTGKYNGHYLQVAMCPS
jgi:hypothetical protein